MTVSRSNFGWAPSSNIMEELHTRNGKITSSVATPVLWNDVFAAPRGNSRFQFMLKATPSDVRASEGADAVPGVVCFGGVPTVRKCGANMGILHMPLLLPSGRCTVKASGPALILSTLSHACLVALPPSSLPCSIPRRLPILQVLYAMDFKGRADLGA